MLITIKYEPCFVVIECSIKNYTANQIIMSYSHRTGITMALELRIL